MLIFFKKYNYLIFIIFFSFAGMICGNYIFKHLFNYSTKIAILDEGYIFIINDKSELISVNNFQNITTNKFLLNEIAKKINSSNLSYEKLLMKAYSKLGGSLKISNINGHIFELRLKEEFEESDKNIYIIANEIQNYNLEKYLELESELKKNKIKFFGSKPTIVNCCISYYPILNSHYHYTAIGAIAGLLLSLVLIFSKSQYKKKNKNL